MFWLDQIGNHRQLNSFELSPPILYDLGLEAALGWLLEQIGKQHDITYQLEYDPQPKPLDDDISALLYHAVRELLLNVAKHAQADTVKILVKKHPETIELAQSIVRNAG